MWFKSNLLSGSIPLLLVLFSINSYSVSAPDTSFIFSTASINDTHAYPAFLGNGYMGIRVPTRGEAYEDKFGLATNTFMAGVWKYNSGGEHGSTVSETPAHLPNWTALPFFSEGKQYAFGGSLSDYKQTLDTYNGTLETSSIWSADGRETKIDYMIFVNRDNKYTGGVKLTFTPLNWSGQASVAGILGEGNNLNASSPAFKNNTHTGVSSMDFTINTRLPVGNGGTYISYQQQLFVPDNLHATTSVFPSSSVQSGIKYTFQVTKGKTYTITKDVSFAEGSTPEKASAISTNMLKGATKETYQQWLQASENAWHKIWKTDILIGGDSALQKQLHAMEYYLYSNGSPDGNNSLSPVGLTNDSYNMHVFWDADTWMFPNFLLLNPDYAKSMIQYRVNRLDTAITNAKRAGFLGAKFPWESAIEGYEAIPPGNDPGNTELHISSDVALAAWNYYLATGDKKWLQSSGWPLLDNIANFWVSRSTLNSNGSYSINNVMGPDEYHDHVDDSFYTNFAAKDTLNFATKAAQLLGKVVNSSWNKVASKLVLPYDSARGIHPEFKGYTGQIIKQADTIMAYYPWGMQASPQVMASDIAYYASKTDARGPAMSTAIDAILYSELHQGEKAYKDMQSILSRLHGPFDEFYETPTGGARNFLTGIGGFMQIFTYGFSGIRLSDPNTFVINHTTLPNELKSITLQNIHWHNRTLTLSILPGCSSLTLTSGEPMPVDIDGKLKTLASGQSINWPKSNRSRH